MDAHVPPAGAGTTQREEEEKSLELSHQAERQLFPRPDPAVRPSGQRAAFAPKFSTPGFPRKPPCLLEVKDVPASWTSSQSSITAIKHTVRVLPLQ